ncbi:head GIN domain-containing protein [Fulvivirgaceae bacterium BMA10]|uniref:Head GIN domain-containing protein n=1 Tax=Splendidivirga corallicola TaxID=3051826 RepID=A0ABT8KP50_9BACT|nr:head GIN domain-containing protein [Fulvivirgaceae bacterium BMA10]
MKNINTLVTKLILLTLFITQFSDFSYGQRTSRELKSFDKIIVSPLIELVLIKGDKESISLESWNVEEDRINARVKGKTLRIYLDKAKVNVKYKKGSTPERWRWQRMYKGGGVKAYVTYKTLKHLQVRGDEQVVCNDPLINKKFRIKVYGEADVTLASVEADYMKTSLYGENLLEIKSGNAHQQVYKVYGSNVINTKKLNSRWTKASVFGESELAVNVSDVLRISAIGETEIYYKGSPEIQKGMIIGNTHFRRIR